MTPDGLPFSSQPRDAAAAPDETRHALLQDDLLAQRFRALKNGESFTLGTTAFGSGLTFLGAWQLFEQVAPAGASLDFFCIEATPPDDEALRAALAQLPGIKPFAEALQAYWRRRIPGWNRWSFAGGRVRLTLVIAGVAEALQPAPAVDAWLPDTRPPQQPVTRKPAPERMPRTAIVIGGGIAGCAAAHALAQRGISVTLLERAPQLASAASGNPRGILHARFGASDEPQHRFIQAAYGHALALLDEVLPVDGDLRAECGLLQLDFSPNEHKRITRLAEREWPAHLLRVVDAAQATALTGMEMAHGGLWFPAGGWIVPPALCARLVSDARIESRLAHTVETLTESDAGWRAAGRDGQNETWTCTADIAVVCCAQSALALQQFAHLPLTPVRGQISLLPATAASRSLHAVVCGNGYCAPAMGGVHVTGATHAFDDESLDVRTADHADNLAKLAAHAPALHAALGAIDIGHLAGRASVRCSAPGALPLVGELQAGLYCSLAHSTRGMLTAGLSGEVVAALACGQLAPLPDKILAALSPHLRGARTKN